MTAFLATWALLGGCGFGVFGLLALMALGIEDDSSTVPRNLARCAVFVLLLPASLVACLIWASIRIFTLAIFKEDS